MPLPFFTLLSSASPLFNKHIFALTPGLPGGMGSEQFDQRIIGNLQNRFYIVLHSTWLHSAILMILHYILLFLLKVLHSMSLVHLGIFLLHYFTLRTDCAVKNAVLAIP